MTKFELWWGCSFGAVHNVEQAFGLAIASCSTWEVSVVSLQVLCNYDASPVDELFAYHISLF
jgi:hypothetical protein